MYDTMYGTESNFKDIESICCEKSMKTRDFGH